MPVKRFYFQMFILLFLLQLPANLFANDDIYDVPGPDTNRNTVSIADFESIDPFTGAITLSFNDLHLPGNGGLDLDIKRVYRSRSRCTTTYANNCLTNNEDSWVGIGWILHFGRLICAASSPCTIEMPDGSRHQTFQALSGGGFITKDYWRLDNDINGTETTPVLTMTDGKKITFGHKAGLNSSYLGSGAAEYYASQIEDTNGNYITITYYADNSYDDYYGAIDTITDSLGRTIKFSLTSSPVGGRYRLDHVTRPDNVQIRFTYDDYPDTIYGTAMLIRVTPPVGDPWTFQYNSTPLTSGVSPAFDLLKVSTPYGGAISYAYSLVTGPDNVKYHTVNAKASSGADISQATWSFQYFQGTNNEYTYVNDPCGRTVKYQHYSPLSILNGNAWKVGLPISKTTYIGAVLEEAFTYDWAPSAEKISFDDYRVSLTKQDYDVYVPYLSKQTVTRGPSAYVTSYSNFDNFGNPKSITESGSQTRSKTITYWSDTTKNIVHGKPLTETVTGSLSGSFTTTYSYDSKANMTRLNKYGAITDYSYFANGNLATVKDPNLNNTSYEWTNGAISKITNPVYSILKTINTLGMVTTETNGRGYATSFAYDNNLRLTGITPPIGNPTIISYPVDNSYKKESRGGYYTTTYFDGLGRPSGTSDSRGIVTDIAYKSCGLKDYTTANIGDTLRYDNFGRVISSTHQDNTKITNTYSGNTLTVTDENSKQTILNYNAFGSPEDKLLASVTDANGTIATYSWNILGSLTGTTQGTLTRTFSYDTRNFLTSETNPEDGTVTYGRDNAGNMKTKTDAYGTKAYTYDSINRLTGISFGTAILSYGYDNADNRITMKSPSASYLYAYDAANRLTQQQMTYKAIKYTTKYGYDLNDNLVSLTYPSGAILRYTYNTNNQPVTATGFTGSVTNITYNTAGLPLSSTYSNGITNTSTYNNRNLTTGITSTLTTAAIIDMDYGYDSRGNTTTIDNRIDSALSQTFTYDSLSRILKAVGDWGTETYTYNVTGNRLKFNVRSYTYAGNRLSKITHPQNGILETYTYNGKGSLTGITLPTKAYLLKYDGMNNLTSYILKGATAAENQTLAAFAYDGDGQRVAKTAGGKTTVYHRDKDGNIIYETDNTGKVIANYGFVNGRLVMKKEPAGLYFYHNDPAGTPIAMTNSTGDIVWKADYKPFGNEVVSIQAEENRRMFVGKERDAETGLYYFGARYMSAAVGRFTAVDPVGPVDEKTGKVNGKMLLNPQRLNRYAYALNNPYRYVDPDGQFAFVLAPLAIPALEALGYSALGLTTFKVLEQAYKNYKDGMYNESTSNDTAVNGTKTEQESSKADSGQSSSGKPKDKDKSSRQRGDRWKTGDDSQQQLEQIEKAQQAVRDGKLKHPIDSIEKSKQRLKSDLRNIKTSGDTSE